ncbi:MAG TPA: hypothetical protein VK538_07720 [Solirubrobacteraceae bacterium]|nr:hypothetical protein [Solirubrobacteraceae bacterium]
MISSEVQRTLVKSPPELWAELSDPAALARHLGELGEIRITRVEPEQKVEWEAGETSGTVSIKPSGWGTKVKLTVTRELAEPEASAEGEESLLEPPPFTIPLTAAGSAFVRGTHARLAPEAVEITREAEPEPEVEHAGEPEPADAPTPRRGFFARLFGRRHAARAEQEPSEETQSEPQPEADAESQSGPKATAEVLVPAEEHVPPAEQPSDAHEPIEPEANSYPSEEIGAAEEVAAEEVTAVLTGVLDRLGEAHHRPFSRS